MPWCNLPDPYGPYTTAYDRFDRKVRPSIFDVTSGRKYDSQIDADVSDTRRQPLVVSAGKGFRQREIVSADQK